MGDKGICKKGIGGVRGGGTWSEVYQLGRWYIVVVGAC